MNVTWFCIMNVEFWNFDMFPMSVDLYRFYFDDYVVSIMLFDLFLVDGVDGL